jgi:Cysteine-rich secretory protein family
MAQANNKSLTLILIIVLSILVTPICHANFTAAEIDAMLAAHNQVRSGVAPTAADMTRLVWDSNLATVAQNWANQCVFSHNDGRNTDYAALSTNAGQVGENIFVTTRPRADALSGPNSAVVSWASEVTDYNYSTNSCISGEICVHYTQLVWANSLRVGCGVSQCPTITGLSSAFIHIQ